MGLEIEIKGVLKSKIKGVENSMRSLFLTSSIPSNGEEMDSKIKIENQFLIEP